MQTKSADFRSVAPVGWATAVVVSGLWAASLVMQERPAAADPAEAVAPPVRADAALHVRYAEARLRLAELKLAKGEELNRRTPGLLTETDMRRLRNRVEVLRAQVAATKDLPHGNGLSEQRAEAKAMARIAAEDLQAATAVHRRQPQAVSENDLRQCEVKAEIARLRADLWDDPTFRGSVVDVMQMQIDQIADVVTEAAAAVEAAPGINRR